LLLAFFYKFYPKIIEDGRVFIANPPIKKLTMSDGKYFYIHTDSDYNRLMRKFNSELFDLVSIKTNIVLSKELFEEFIYHCTGYDILINNHSKALAMDPDLLEHIVVNINDLVKCTNNIDDKFNKAFYRKTGYTVSRNDDIFFTFDKDINHFNLKMDKGFIDHHFSIIREKLEEIMIYGVYLRGKNSGKEYRGTIYYLMKIMNSILGQKIEITRFKGLGEMEYYELGETVINPTTRMLTRVNMNDAVKAEKAMKLFMSDQNIKYKRIFYAGKVDFD